MSPKIRLLPDNQDNKVKVQERFKQESMFGRYSPENAIFEVPLQPCYHRVTPK